MKIETTNPIGSVDQTSTATQSKPAKTENDFAALLESEMPLASTEESNQLQESAFALEHLNTISNAALLFSLENNVSAEETAAAAVEDTLSGLEKLGQLLEDQGVSLEQVDTALNDLSETLPRLQEQTSQLPDDHPLRQMGEELSVLVAVESIKWNRGDYV